MSGQDLGQHCQVVGQVAVCLVHHKLLVGGAKSASCCLICDGLMLSRPSGLPLLPV
jgi:hypothetical protein